MLKSISCLNAHSAYVDCVTAAQSIYLCGGSVETRYGLS